MEAKIEPHGKKSELNRDTVVAANGAHVLFNGYLAASAMCLTFPKAKVTSKEDPVLQAPPGFQCFMSSRCEETIRKHGFAPLVESHLPSR